MLYEKTQLTTHAFILTVSTREFVIVENMPQEIVRKDWSQCSAGVTMYRHQ